MFFFLLEFEVYTGVGRPIIVEGLASCNKTVILFGSEGNSVTYSSRLSEEANVRRTKSTRNLPIAQVDVVEMCIRDSIIIS